MAGGPGAESIELARKNEGNSNRESLPRDSRETVINAFEKAFQKFSGVAANSKDPEVLRQFRAIDIARNETIKNTNNPQDTFVQEFQTNDGRTIHQREGIPVEDLLRFLRDQRQGIQEQLKQLNLYPKEHTAKERTALQRQRDEINQIGRIIYRNSVRYSEVPGRMDPAILVGRMQKEAEFIDITDRQGGSTSENYKAAEKRLGVQEVSGRRNEESHVKFRQNQGRTPWFRAANHINHRLELFIPPNPTLGKTPTIEPHAVVLGARIANGVSKPMPEGDVKPIHEMVVDTDNENHWKNARELANELITQEQRKGWIFNIFRKIGLGSVLQEHYRQRITREIEAESLRTGNSYLNLDMARSSINWSPLSPLGKARLEFQRDANRSESEQAAKDKIKEIRSQFRLKVDEAGRTVVDPDNRKDIIEAKGEIKKRLMEQIINTIAAKGPVDRNCLLLKPPRPILTSQDMNEALKKFVSVNDDLEEVQELFSFFGQGDNRINKLSDSFATNLLEAANRLRTDAEAHDYSLKQLDEHTRILLSNTGWAGKGEAHFTAADRLLNRAQQNRVSALFLNPQTVGIASGLASFGLLRAAGYSKFALPAVGMVAAGPAGLVLGALAAGGAAYWQRGRNLEYDRLNQGLDKAYGKKVQTRDEVDAAIDASTSKDFSARLLKRMPRGLRRALGVYRNADLEREGGYQTVTATDAIHGIRDSLNTDLQDVANQDAAIKKIAELSARITLSNSRRIDLITFDNKYSERGARMKMTKEIVEARSILSARSGLTSSEVESREESAFNAALNTLAGHVNDRDTNFHSYKRRQQFGAAAVAAGTSISGGLLSQESFAIVRRALGATVAPTMLETVLSGSLDSTRRSGGVFKDTFQDMFKDTAANSRINLATGVTVVADGPANGDVRPVSFTVDGQTIRNGALLHTDGTISMPDTLNHLPPKLQAALTDTAHFETADVHKGLGFSINDAQDIYSKSPATVNISNNLKLQVGFGGGSTHPTTDIFQSPDAKGVSFTDASGNVLNKQPIYMYPDGHFAVAGDPDTLDSSIKNFLQGSGWQETSNSHFDLAKEIKNLVDTKGEHVYRFGNVEMHVRGIDKHFSITDFSGGKTMALGTVNSDGTFTIPRDYLTNKDLTDSQIQHLYTTLKNEGWSITLDKTPGTGTIVDQMLSQSPEQLRARGIIETDQFQKTWNFHVLRPDIVNSTGMHTHNELTMHHGGEYDVVNPSTNAVTHRFGVGKIGVLNLGAEIDGGWIQAHLAGVGPETDTVLNDLIKKSNGLQTNQMVAVIDLTNGKQIMLPFDASGNAQLPTEIYDAATGGLRGVKSIAAGVIQGPDGKIIPAQEILTTGQIQQGSVMHSLTSERYLERPAPQSEGIAARLTPPSIREIIPPADRMETIFKPKLPVFEDSPWFDTPIAPRHPLSPNLPPDSNRRKDGYKYDRPEDDQQRWIETRSKTLIVDPEAKLDQQDEIQNYFNRMDASRRNRIESLKQQLAFEPLASTTRGIVCIPVAAAYEAENIDKTLELFKNQTHVANQDYELVVYLNWKNDADKTAVHQSFEKLDKFKQNNPNMPIRIIYEELESKTFTIGDVMKTVNDVAMKRIQTAGIKNDVMLTVIPADTKGLSTNFLEKLIKNADGDKDVYTVQYDYGTMYYDKYPGFHVASRVLLNIERLKQQNYPAPLFTRRVGLQKKASMLAAVGNYDETLTIGEDADIGRKVVAARLANKPQYTSDQYPIGRTEGMWAEVDPARLLECYKMGKNIADAWENFDENGYNPRPVNPLSGTGENIESDSDWNDIVSRIESQLSMLAKRFADNADKAINLALGTSLVYALDAGKPILDTVTDASGRTYKKRRIAQKIARWEKNPDGSIVLTTEGKERLREQLKRYRDQKLNMRRYRGANPRGNRVPV